MAGPMTPVEPDGIRTTQSQDEQTTLVKHFQSDPPSVGAPLEAAAVSSSSDRLRAVYLLASEFAEEESMTAITSPPGSHSDANSPALHTEPVDRPVLLRMDGVQAGEVVSLAILPCFIGRHPSCQIVIDDAGVSRKHVRIVLQNDEFWLEDLGSRNGTFVDGKRLERKHLQDGALIQVGLYASFRFTVVSARQEKLLRELYESSTRDSLTGLYNRRHFDDRIKAEFAYAKRHQLDVAFVMVDVDFFKRVNDTHGHATGDSVLKAVAKNLAKQLRTEDVFARVGGEEFAILLRGVASEGARKLAERLRANIEALPIVAEGKTVAVTISAGCASMSETKDQTPGSLYGLADRRLYDAKHQGRNRVVSQ